MFPISIFIGSISTNLNKSQERFGVKTGTKTLRSKWNHLNAGENTATIHSNYTGSGVDWEGVCDIDYQLPRNLVQINAVSGRHQPS